MSTTPNNFVPTPRLRFVEREVTTPGMRGPVNEMVATVKIVRILQQYFAEDVAGYMRNQGAGEWRDVPLETP
jgi:hypothetical protein